MCIKGGYWITTNFQINQIADREFGRVNVPLTTYWIGLLTAIPNADGTGAVEVSSAGTGYARQALANDKTTLSNAVNGRVYNLNNVTFPSASAPWGIISAVGIYNAQNGGNLLYFSPQSTPRPFDEGDIAFFEPGDIEWIVQNILD